MKGNPRKSQRNPGWWNSRIWPAGFWFVRERLSWLTPLPKIWCFLHPKVLIFFSLWLLPVEQTLRAFCRVAWQIWLRTHCTDLRLKVQTATCLANWVWSVGVVQKEPDAKARQWLLRAYRRHHRWRRGWKREWIVDHSCHVLQRQQPPDALGSTKVWAKTMVLSPHCCHRPECSHHHLERGPPSAIQGGEIHIFTFSAVTNTPWMMQFIQKWDYTSQSRRNYDDYPPWN